MKLAFSSNAYLRFTLENKVRRIAGFGYRGIELLADVPHAWPAGIAAGASRRDSEAVTRDL